MFTLLMAAYRFCWCLLALSTLAVLPALAQQTGFGAQTQPHTIVYKLKTGQLNNARTAAVPGLQQALKQIGAKDVHQKFPQMQAAANARRALHTDISRIYQANYSSELSFEQVKRALLSTGQVAYVEPVYLREPFHAVSDPHADSTKTTAYYLKLIQAYEAWNVTHGDTNVVIGIIDTGFRIDHLDLKNNIKYNYNDPIDGIDNDGDGYIDNFAGWDFADKDNNVQPAPRWGGHGMGVAGVAGATPNNGIGVAGVGYKTKILPIKVFSSSADGTFGGGYEAIIYAIDKGCKIINLSWGGEVYSQYEQDIINYAVLDRDAVIVSAAGNSKKQANLYPASYANVLSVGGSDKNDNKYKDYTWGYHIDLLAPSFDIYSTSIANTNSYGYNWGSSFASPMVAAAAALVRAQYPHLNAQQVMERVRVTTDKVSHIPANQPFEGMIGSGRLNIKKALKQTKLKAARCTSFAVTGNRSAQSGSTVSFQASFLNVLDPVTNLQVKLSTTSPHISIENPALVLGSMGTMATANNHQSPFQVTIAPDMPFNTTIAFRLDFTDGTYADYQYFELVVNPDFHTLDANNLRLTVNSKGNLGYNGLNLSQGVGMQYKGSSSMLFEGGLMIGVSPERVSDNLRNANWKNDGDFTPVVPARIHYNSTAATQEIRGLMQDTYPSTNTVGVEVKHRSLAWNTETHQDYIIQEFTVKNLTADTLKNVATGLFADWDIGVYYQNAADWDATRNLGYVYNTVGAYPLAGIKLLTPQEPTYYAIDNMGEAGSIAVDDGFTNAEKYNLMANGVSRTKANGFGNGNNVSHVVGGKLAKLAPGESRVVSFAIVAGDNLEALQQHADAAQQKYMQIKSGPAPVAVEEIVCKGSNYTWEPEGGKNYRFYADEEKKKFLGSGASYTLENITADATIYATNADSVFESRVVSARLVLPAAPTLDFSYDQQKIYAGFPVTFTNQSTGGHNLVWSALDTEIRNEEFITLTFPSPGTYSVSITASDNYSCTTYTFTKQIKVLEALAGPAPVPFAQTICPGRSITWAPEGGSRFHFYADSQKEKLIGSGNSYTFTSVTESTTIYAANADSVIESSLSSATITLFPVPTIDFVFEADKIYPGTPVTFVSVSKDALNLAWTFENASLNEYHGERSTVSFPAPGVYRVTLSADGLNGCTDISITKQVNVLALTPDVIEKGITLYPNPADDVINLDLLPDGTEGKFPEIFMTDMTGRKIKPIVRFTSNISAVINLEQIPAGIYQAHIKYSNAYVLRRIVVL
ncbi:S8 family serine peptidase [Pontibacter burrus]|uniref:S8 family serine peptidase n=1 Tax=Pontibacter burrus TaxID=2704466 RepID=A0A6B3LR95_9BACT|nr:S8 family serine peptidase [Pontibacter burrus]NEM98363.1 S8 family serine peptidase [Pontibacter burrus]